MKQKALGHKIAQEYMDSILDVSKVVSQSNEEIHTVALLKVSVITLLRWWRRPYAQSHNPLTIIHSLL